MNENERRLPDFRMTPDSTMPLHGWGSQSAEPVRDTRRLKLREGWVATGDEFMRHWGPDVGGSPHYAAGISFFCAARLWTAHHADGSETDHTSRLEAHDALIASGSESPFVAVTGPAVKS
jgi:hypothetical protein